MALSSSSFRRAGLALAAGAAMGTLSLLSGVANAAPLAKDQCRLANAAISDLFTRYNGKLSAQFVASAKQFVARDCDTDVDFKMVDGTQDKAAFAELRVLLIAAKTAAKPVAYTR